MEFKASNYDPIEKYLPKEGWLADYFKFSKSLQACARFKFFTACCMLGACISNKVWIQRGDVGLLEKLFPNPWVILLAPPGRGNKTSTINMGVNCLYQAVPEVRILADKLTPESLVKCLSEPPKDIPKIRIGPSDATGLIKAPELSVFFGKQQYNTGLVSLVTDLYDYREEWSSDTIMRGKNVLKRNCISILGGSTPDWLQKMLPEDAFTGGFMSRFIIVEMPPNYYVRTAFPKHLSGLDWGKLCDGLRKFYPLRGEVLWQEEARNAFQKYYETTMPSGDIQKDAYLEREPEQLLRIGMLLSLSKTMKLELRVEDFFQAKEILQSLLEETSPRIEHLTTHPRMQLVQEIPSLMRQYGGKMRENELMKLLYRGLALGEPQFRESIRVLKIAGVITSDSKFPNPTYKLVTEEKINDNLVHAGEAE